MYRPWSRAKDQCSEAGGGNEPAHSLRAPPPVSLEGHSSVCHAQGGGAVAMAEDEEGPPAPAGLKRLFREFWFQVGVAVTATLICSLAVTVLPRVKDSSDNGKASATPTVVIQNAD